MKLLVLDATNKSVTAVMSGAPATIQPDFVTTYADSTSTNFIEAPNDGTLNGTTPVTIVGSPAASTRRVVKDIVIFNRDTAAVTIDINFVNGANTRRIWHGVLQANESMTIDAVYDSNGLLKSASSGVISTALGGTGQDFSADTGVILLTAGVASALATTGSGNAVRATNPAVDMTGGSLVLPATASALAATEGAAKWDSTLKQMALYDGVRERVVSPIGYQPFALPSGHLISSAYSLVTTLAAAGGTVVIPIFLHAGMLLQSVSAVNTDVSLVKTWGWDLYVDRSNGSNSINRVAQSTADETFTAAAASLRTINASTAGIYLAPGCYYLAVQNRHASNTFGLGSQFNSSSILDSTQAKTKTTTNPNGSTLDIIAATWTAIKNSPGVRLNGRAANDTVAW